MSEGEMAVPARATGGIYCTLMGDVEEPAGEPTSDGGDSESESGATADDLLRGSFKHVFDRYADSIEALRDFHDTLGPVVSGLEEDASRTWRETTERALSDFANKSSPEDRQQLAAFFEQMVEGKGRIALVTPSHELSVLLEAFVRGLRRNSSRRHTMLLQGGILMSLVGSFEILVADIMGLYYRMHSGSLETEEKTLSLKDIINFGTIDDARDFLIGKKVDDLLRDDLDGWCKAFKSHLGLDIPKIPPYWDQFAEIIQRRHIWVHNGGRASRRYLEKVNWPNVKFPSTRPDADDVVWCDSEYITLAIDLFEICGVILFQEVWKKLARHHSVLRWGHAETEGLHGVIFRNVVASRWFVVEHLSLWGSRDDAGDEGDRTVSQCNYWLAVKRQGRLAEVEDALLAFDTSAKAPVFAAVTASLREDVEAFFRVAPRCDFDEDSLRGWPILDEVRDDPRFEALVDSVCAGEDARIGPADDPRSQGSENAHAGATSEAVSTDGPPEREAPV